MQPDLVQKIFDITGQKTEVISGKEEARLAALGVLYGHPKADGVVADLGGGSLELQEIKDGQIGDFYTSLKMGVWRLVEMSKGKPSEVAKLVTDELSKYPELSALRGKTLYLVGSNLRDLAKYRMKGIHFRFKTVQGYNEPLPTFTPYLEAQIDKKKTPEKDGRSTLPFAASALISLIKILQPSQLFFSSFGLREGRFLELLSQEEQKKDPLLVFADREAGLPNEYNIAPHLFDWISGALPNETPPNLYRAACLLSLSCGKTGRDHEADHGFDTMARLRSPGLTHNERAFLATVMFMRHGGKVSDLHKIPERLITPEQTKEAIVLGQLLNFAYAVSGGFTSVLNDCSLTREGKTLKLTVGNKAKPFVTAVMLSKLQKLAKSLGTEDGLVVSTDAPSRPPSIVDAAPFVARL